MRSAEPHGLVNHTSDEILSCNNMFVGSILILLERRDLQSAWISVCVKQVAKERHVLT
jgi:hypothetical protein